MTDHTHNKTSEASEPTDAELIERWRRDGDAEAMTVLVARYERPLRAMARRMLGSEHDATDVMQTCWVRVLTAMKRPEFELRYSAMTWLWTITRNAAVDQLRRRTVRASEPIGAESEPPDPRDQYAPLEAQIMTEQLFAELSDTEREAITLVWLRGLAHHEAAAVLGIPEGTIKSRCWRGRAKMIAAIRRSGLITENLDRA